MSLVNNGTVCSHESSCRAQQEPVYIHTLYSAKFHVQETVQMSYGELPASPTVGEELVDESPPSSSSMMGSSGSRSGRP